MRVRSVQKRPSPRKLVPGPWGLLASFCASAVAQELPPAVPPSPALPPPNRAPAAPPRPEPASVEDLAERLRAMEERNRELTERLERSERSHERQMRLLLDRIDAL